MKPWVIGYLGNYLAVHSENRLVIRLEFCLAQKRTEATTEVNLSNRRKRRKNRKPVHSMYLQQKLAKKAFRKYIFYRDGGKCKYCKTPLTLGNATMDHVIPRSKGGTDNEGNIWLSCESCNFKKADTPAAIFIRKVRGNGIAEQSTT